MKHRMTTLEKTIRNLLSLAVSLSLSGCVFALPDKIHYDFDDPTFADCTECSALANETEFVGVAFSGGGSRAAVFAAAGAEALEQAGWLQRTTHISSVSGGSFASSYLFAHPLERCRMISDPEGTEACVSEYFYLYKNKMRENYIYPTIFRDAYPNRFLSPTRRLVSLKEVLDNRFLENETFGSIPRDPVLLINAASYDDSRRFVFSNRAISETPKTDRFEATAPFDNRTLSMSSFALDGCLYRTPDDLPLSLAVATSAGFPPVFGPTSIHVPAGTCGQTTDQYWHLGDGGILENTGVETLQEILLRSLSRPNRLKRAIIFSFDAGNYTASGASKNVRNLRQWTTNPGQVVFISNLRAEALRAENWAAKEKSLPIPVSIMTFRPDQTATKSWPESCSKRKRRASTIRDHIGQIPTNLKITNCDADLLEISAKEQVHRHLNHPVF